MKPTSKHFFEQMYARDLDPWSFASSPYETARYDATMRAMGGRRFKRALEPGCSIGVLTQRLASIACEVHAFDISPTAVARARERCQSLPHVQISVREFDCNLAVEEFDLLVLSEIGYYFPASDLARVAQSLVQKLSLNGIVVAVHWLGSSPDHVLSGDQVHQLLGNLSGIEHEWGERQEGYRLDRWRRA